MLIDIKHCEGASRPGISPGHNGPRDPNELRDRLRLMFPNLARKLARMLTVALSRNLFIYNGARNEQRQIETKNERTESAH